MFILERYGTISIFLKVGRMCEKLEDLQKVLQNAAGKAESGERESERARAVGYFFIRMAKR